MTETATTGRKNESIRAFVQLSDSITERQRALKEDEKRLEKLTESAIADIGESGRLAFTLKGLTRIVEVSSRISVSRIKGLDEKIAVNWAIDNGLKLTEQPPVIVASATLRKAVLDGVDASGIAVVNRTPAIDIT